MSKKPLITYNYKPSGTFKSKRTGGPREIYDENDIYDWDRVIRA